MFLWKVKYTNPIRWTIKKNIDAETRMGLGFLSFFSSGHTGLADRKYWKPHHSRYFATEYCSDRGEQEARQLAEQRGGPANPIVKIRYLGDLDGTNIVLAKRLHALDSVLTEKRREVDALQKALTTATTAKLATLKPRRKTAKAG